MRATRTAAESDASLAPGQPPVPEATARKSSTLPDTAQAQPRNPITAPSVSPGKALEDGPAKPELPAATTRGLPTDPTDPRSGTPAQNSTPHQTVLPVSTALPAPPIELPLPVGVPALQTIDLSSLPVPGVAGPSASAPLYQQAAEDPGLAVTVLPHAAHLSLASSGGDLSLHVRVRDGNTDVNVSGSMAPMFESKAPEVRAALATQGLALGSFATDQHGSQQYSQQRTESLPNEAFSGSTATRRQSALSGPEVTISDEGRIHITA